MGTLIMSGAHSAAFKTFSRLEFGMRIIVSSPHPWEIRHKFAASAKVMCECSISIHMTEKPR